MYSLELLNFQAESMMHVERVAAVTIVDVSINLVC